MAEGKLAVKKCSCDSEYQDKRYGKGMRLHNTSFIKDRADRCTNCLLTTRYVLDTSAYDRAFPKKR